MTIQIHEALLNKLKNKKLLDLSDIEKCATSGHGTFEVEDPSEAVVREGEPLAQLPDSMDVECAIKTAHEAFQSYSKTLASTRAQQLRDIAKAHRDHLEDLAIILSCENGKPIRESREEIEMGAAYFEWFAEEARRAYGMTLPDTAENLAVKVIPQPVGPCGLVAPFNFPSGMFARKVSAALAAGCTVVARPSSNTPLSAIAMYNLIREIIPDYKVFNLVVGSGKNSAEAGKMLCQDKRIKKFSFTGSTEVGKLFMEHGASTVTRMSMELGGNAPVIVFDCADLDLAADGVVKAKMFNNGQTCICANRIFVHDKVFDDVMERVKTKLKKIKIGHALDENADVGSMIHAKAKKNMQELLEDAVKNGGAKVLLGPGAKDDEDGGESKSGSCGDCMKGSCDECMKGNFFPPTLLVNASEDCRVAKEEIFGPILNMIRFSDEKDVLRKSNNVDVGLAAYVFARDVGTIERMSRGLEFGLVGVNTTNIALAEVPFGGVKQSGFGKEGGKEGLDDYLNYKAISMQY